MSEGFTSLSGELLDISGGLRDVKVRSKALTAAGLDEAAAAVQDSREALRHGAPAEAALAVERIGSLVDVAGRQQGVSAELQHLTAASRMQAVVVDAALGGRS